MLSNNPFPDEKTDAMEELQPRPVPQTPVPQVSAPQAAAAYPTQQGAEAMTMDIASGETHGREGALTIMFAIGKLNDYLQWFLMVLETILVLRFVLRMFGADPTGLFANFIFSLTEILLVPFKGIVPIISLHDHQAFEFSTLFAAAIYFLVFYALKRFLHILVSNPEEPVE